MKLFATPKANFSSLSQQANDAEMADKPKKKKGKEPSAQTLHGMLKLSKPLVFDRSGRVQLYHADGSQNYLHMLARLNMMFISTSSFLLVMEIISPCKSQSNRSAKRSLF